MVHLPVFFEARESERYTPEPSMQNMDNTRPVLEGKKILIVDDDDDTRMLLTFILDCQGAKTHSVESAYEALNLIDQVDFDMIVSDIGMPGMNGYALAQELRRLRPGTLPPLAALSSFTSPEDKQKAISAGFNFHIGKPLDPEAFTDFIGEVLKYQEDAE